MAKANRVNTTPRRTASKIESQKLTESASPACPVVALSQQLMELWDVDNASQQEYLKDEVRGSFGDFVGRQIAEWQSALAHIISFTQAESPAGAMVQIALARDELDSMIGQLDEENQKVVSAYQNQIDRLLRSAMRGVRAPLGEEEFKSVEAILNVYSSDSHCWFDEMEKWSKEGREYRESKPD